MSEIRDTIDPSSVMEVDVTLPTETAAKKKRRRKARSTRRKSRSANPVGGLSVVFASPVSVYRRPSPWEGLLTDTEKQSVVSNACLWRVHVGVYCTLDTLVNLGHVNRFLRSVIHGTAMAECWQQACAFLRPWEKGRTNPGECPMESVWAYQLDVPAWMNHYTTTTTKVAPAHHAYGAHTAYPELPDQTTMPPPYPLRERLWQCGVTEAYQKRLRLRYTEENQDEDETAEMNDWWAKQMDPRVRVPLPLCPPTAHRTYQLSPDAREGGGYRPDPPGSGHWVLRSRMYAPQTYLKMDRSDGWRPAQGITVILPAWRDVSIRESLPSHPTGDTIFWLAGLAYTPPHFVAWARSMRRILLTVHRLVWIRGERAHRERYAPLYRSLMEQVSEGTWTRWVDGLYFWLLPKKSPTPWPASHALLYEQASRGTSIPRLWNRWHDGEKMALMPEWKASHAWESYPDHAVVSDGVMRIGALSYLLDVCWINEGPAGLEALCGEGGREAVEQGVSMGMGLIQNNPRRREREWGGCDEKEERRLRPLTKKVRMEVHE